MNTPFLTASELKKLTGTSSPKEQVGILRSYGLQPFVDQKTGKPVIYRTVVMDAQKASANDGVVMSLENI